MYATYSNLPILDIDLVDDDGTNDDIYLEIIRSCLNIHPKAIKC